MLDNTARWSYPVLDLNKYASLNSTSDVFMIDQINQKQLNNILSMQIPNIFGEISQNTPLNQGIKTDFEIMGIKPENTNLVSPLQTNNVKTINQKTTNAPAPALNTDIFEKSQNQEIKLKQEEVNPKKEKEEYKNDDDDDDDNDDDDNNKCEKKHESYKNNWGQLKKVCLHRGHDKKHESEDD